ncbi:MAG: dipicolinate synthase subunit B [Oscillospiraceae bacterium]|nr:dipicolinate synthase subunit B [Oscillospiraceae bacterium]
MDKLNIGFALTGSFCTFKRVIPVMRLLKEAGHNIIPIMSYNAYNTDTRFGKAESFISEIEGFTGNKIIASLNDAEPIGPKKLLDILVIEPCTGNTLAKLAAGIADTPVTLAAKSHLRNQRPLLIAISSNDALAGAAKNIGMLQNYKNVFFVPYTQDDPQEKPNSIVAKFEKTEEAIKAALNGTQIQPILIG